MVFVFVLVRWVISSLGFLCTMGHPLTGLASSLISALNPHLEPQNQFFGNNRLMTKKTVGFDKDQERLHTSGCRGHCCWRCWSALSSPSPQMLIHAVAVVGRLVRCWAGRKAGYPGARGSGAWLGMIIGSTYHPLFTLMMDDDDDTTSATRTQLPHARTHIE